MRFHEMGTVKNALKNYEVRNLIAKGIKAVFSLLVSGRIHTGVVWLAGNAHSHSGANQTSEI